MAAGATKKEAESAMEMMMPTEASANDGLDKAEASANDKSDKAEASANDESDKVVDQASPEETPGRVHKFFEIHYTVKIKNTPIRSPLEIL